MRTQTKAPPYYSTKMKTTKVLVVLGFSATALVAIAVTGAALIFTRGDDNTGKNKGATTTVLEGLEAAPTVEPTVSHMPTLAPSGEPSTAPSNVPSSLPSQIPTEMPSSAPSLVPSSLPSTAPSLAPSSAPSQAPSSLPSIAPSPAPTRVATPAPTYTPITRKFRLKMHWDNYKWQDDDVEQFWCLACAKCDETNFSEFSREEYDCESGYCEEDEQLWVRDCRDGYGAEFRVEAVPDGYLIGVSGTNVCMARTGNRFVTLQGCDSGSERQKWAPFSADGRLELSPVYTDTHYCLSQHHHPKSYEIVGLKTCEEAHDSDTGYWNLYELDG